MQQVSTGVRRLQAGALAARAFKATPGVRRAELIAAARDACEALNLRAGVRSVLMELAACYGEQELEAGLIVWPSNLRLIDRTGLSERSIRLCISTIVSHGLIEPRDSANRKRFAIKRGGAIIDAFGFNLAPIWARREEFAVAILARKHAREILNRRYDEITIHRKAIEEALRLIEDEAFARRFGDLMARTPRRGVDVELDGLIAEYVALRAEVENAFHSKVQENEIAGDAGAGRRHKEQNNEPPIGDCKQAFGEERGLDPALIIEACPALLQWASDMPLDIPGFITTAAKLRGTIGAHPDAWTEAIGSVGAFKAAALVCYVLQIHDDDVAANEMRIKNPGGLYRALVRRLAEGGFNLRAEFFALKRRRDKKKGGPNP